MVFYLPDQVDIFPHPYLAEEDGLLALSAGMTPSKILLAYQFGIFPWSNDEEPVLWWYTHPRCIVYPSKVKVSKSMHQVMKSGRYHWTMDKAFDKVIEKCQKVKREGQSATWITENLKNCFIKLHNQGFAHSVEVWDQDDLVGGLYGLSLGKIFFGESMFSDKSNASKFGFIKFAQWLEAKGFNLIDCQQETEHLISLGAEMVSGVEFFKTLKSNIFEPTFKGSWNIQ